MFIIRPAFVGFSPYFNSPPQKIKIFFVGLNINDYLCTRKQESLCFHLHYRRRGSCLIPGPAVKTTQTGRGRGNSPFYYFVFKPDSNNSPSINGFGSSGSSKLEYSGLKSSFISPTAPFRCFSIIIRALPCKSFPSSS